MNKLQQEIIEIIEPYMDKTLSEGCLVDCYGIGVYRGETYKSIKISKDGFLKKTKTKTFSYPKDVEFAIIGHYDITAVLKCIESKKQDIQDKYNDTIGKDKKYWDKVQTVVKIKGNTLNIGLWENIPNKPLHLYTEEENKDLLQLLKKLGTN